MTTTEFLECSSNSYKFVPNHHPSKSEMHVNKNTHYCNKFLSLPLNKTVRFKNQLYFEKVRSARTVGIILYQLDTRNNQHFSLIMVTGFLKNNYVHEKTSNVTYAILAIMLLQIQVFRVVMPFDL
jgi:hypothetical protein